jgi:hypothetical protein
MGMKAVLPILAIIALLVCGCAQQPAQSNSTEQPNASSNATPPQAQPNQTVYSGNITAPPKPPPSNSTNQTQPTANQTSANQTNQNSTPALAPGLPFPESNYSLHLDDVSLVPSSSGPCGIFSVRDQNGTILDKLLICPSESQDWVSPQGHLYRIRVDQVAAGYSTQENWAKVEIFS